MTAGPQTVAGPPGRGPGRARRRVSDLARRYREQLTFLVVGGWNTLFGFGVFALLYFWLHRSLNVDLILAISFVPSTANAYLWYRYAVFRSRGRMRRELPRFTLVYAIAGLANLGVLPLAKRTLPLNVYVIEALFVVVYVCGSYVAHKYFSFRSARA
jgi:putative flippase GtrA